MNSAHESPTDADAAAARLAAPEIRKGLKFQALHTYTDRRGRALYWRIRLKNPATEEKWIRPMKLEGGRYSFGEPVTQDHGGKPLYRLHDLAARPTDIVIVTEGEFKADRLADLGLLVTTSGGADSARKADWSSLTGRIVIIWPDNDEAGRRYAEAVARVLEPLGCSISILDTEPLRLKVKGDAADWLAANPAATAADVLALRCKPWHSTSARNLEDSDELAVDAGTSSSSPPSRSAVYNDYAGKRFKLDGVGVFFSGKDRDGDEKAPEWICSPLVIKAKTRDNRSAEWGRLLEWLDDDGTRHQWAMPLEHLEGDGAEVRRELARRGLRLATSRNARELLTSYIKSCPVEARARCVDRLGWHGSVFTTPVETIGQSDELVVFQNPHATEPCFGISGTADDWRNSVARLARGNSRLMFVLSVAFAGPLAKLAEEDSGGFHIRGGSSIGKSTLLKAAASVWGDPRSYPRLWRATANGLEGLAAVHNDGLLILDELSQLDPKEAGEAAYLLANGQGKTRATRSGTARPVSSWRLLFLSAGEESLSALMARIGRKVNAGQEIRLADIEADAGARMGAFETLNGCKTPAAISTAIKEAAIQHHGAVGAAWLKVIVKDREKVSESIAGTVRRFVADHVPRGASGQVLRVAQRFGLVAAAGELAAKYGLVDWPDGEASHAVAKCFAAWVDSFGGVGDREERALLAQVRSFFETHGASRFEDASAPIDQRVVNRAGFYRSRGDGEREFLVLPEAFKRDVCAGFDPRMAVQILLARGWLVLPLSNVVHNQLVTRLYLTGPRASFARTSSG